MEKETKREITPKYKVGEPVYYSETHSKFDRFYGEAVVVKEVRILGESIRYIVSLRKDCEILLDVSEESLYRERRPDWESGHADECRAERQTRD